MSPTVSEPSDSDRVRTRRPRWNGRQIRLDGPVAVGQSDTDPGDMGEPRVFEADGVTYVTVPSFDLWPSDDLPPLTPDEARLARAWSRCKAALPEGWGVGIQQIRGQWECGAAAEGEWKRPYWTEGPHEAAALEALAAALEARQP